MKKKGYFIVVEGLEGSGKSTVQQELVHVIAEHTGVDPLLNREPGGTRLAERLRELFKAPIENEEGAECISPETELLLLYAARSHTFQNKIKPALASGVSVISDRYDLSSQAYQGGGRGFCETQLGWLQTIALNDFKPDITFYLDIPSELGLQRIARRGFLDRIEREPAAFFDRVRMRYRELASSDPSIQVVDATRPLMEVIAEIRQSLGRFLVETAK